MNKPPLGVMPFKIWWDILADGEPDGFYPSVEQWRRRHQDVLEALARCREAKAEPHPMWLLELGLVRAQPCLIYFGGA